MLDFKFESDFDPLLALQLLPNCQLLSKAVSEDN